MSSRIPNNTTLFAVATIATFLVAQPAHAYIGPGAGVSLIGALFGIVSMLVIGIWALVKLVLKPLLPKRKTSKLATAVAGNAGDIAVESGDDGFHAENGANPQKSGSSIAVAIIAVIGMAGWLNTPREYVYEWGSAAKFALEGFGDVQLNSLSRPARFDVLKSGVVLHDQTSSFSGLNVELSSMEHAARLLDMEGNELHKWHLDRNAITRIQAAAGLPVSGDLRSLYWRRVTPLSDGSLLILLDNFRTTPYGIGLVKLDWDSNVVWAHAAAYHHSIDVMPDGRIVTLYQEISHSAPAAAGDLHTPYLDEGISILGSDGVEIKRFSFSNAIEGTPYVHLFNKLSTSVKGDPYHANSAIHVSSEIAAGFDFIEPDDIMVSIRNIDTIAVIDSTSGKMRWAASGNWIRQHEAVPTDRGTILLYDNRGAEYPFSRALEWDPRSQEFTWIAQEANGVPIFSEIYGTIATLPNGNRMVSSSESARAMEFDATGKLVWEWRSPQRFGADEDRVPVLLEMLRVPSDFFTGRSLDKGNG